MNESSNAPVYDSTPPTPEPFYQTWIKAITKPNEQTFAEIANSPDAGPNKAYLWVFLSSLASFFLVMLTFTLGTSSSQYGVDISSMMGGSVIALLCAAPIGAGERRRCSLESPGGRPGRRSSTSSTAAPNSKAATSSGSKSA